MPKPEKISSLHDDVRVPLQDKDRPEYDKYPGRHADTGEQGERSVVQRLRQFGVSDADLESAGVKDARKITEDQYSRLVGAAIREQFAFLFANIHGHWKELSGDQQRHLIRETSEMIKSWGNWGIDLVLRGEDVDPSKGSQALISLEGLYVLEDLKNPSEEDMRRALDQIEAAGVRSVALQYSSETKLATKEDGLTELGEHAIRELFERGLLVDLAHSFPGTRRDTMNMAEDLGRGQQLVYTHGAPSEAIAQDPEFSAYAEARGLTDDELKRIMRLGGVIGLGVTRPFFTSPDHLAETFDRLAQFEHGPQSLAIGADFGGVSPAFSIGMMKPDEVSVEIGNLLAGRFGFSEAQISALMRENAQNWVQRALKAE